MYVRRNLRLVCAFALFASWSFVQAQSLPNLQPPSQTYIYDYTGSVGAQVPTLPAFNLGASFTIEFWMFLDPDGVDSQFM